MSSRFDGSEYRPSWLLYSPNHQFSMQVPKDHILQYAKCASRLLNQKLHLSRVVSLFPQLLKPVTASPSLQLSIKPSTCIYQQEGKLQVPSINHPHFSPASNVPPTPDDAPGHTSSHQIRIQHLRPWWLAHSGFVSSVALLRQCDQILGAHPLHLTHLACL